jgi:Ran GTPase-activating protein (RanGAP) involved in mRNA processing and transport
MISNALQEENNLKYISFKNCKLKGDSIKSFFNAFYQKDKKEINPEFHIEAINLSNNNLGYDGIENLCKCLKENKTVKYINLFHNIFDVNGARRLAEVIKINNTLVEIDIGYNRIKNVGFNSIINSIIENENSQIKFLGVKYNFIKENSFENCLKKLSEKINNLLEEIHFKNNSLKDTELMKYYEEFYKNMKKKISVDVFNIIYFLEPDRLNRTIWCTVARRKTKFKNDI